MRKSLLMSAAALGLAIGAPAFVQSAMAQSTTRGTGYSAGYNAPSTEWPRSSQASNINGQDMRSRIAPVLPTPAGSENASPERLLGIAQNALRRGQTGAAQQALEMAETRSLDRITSPSAANTPSSNPMVDQINRALQALGNHDTAGAEQAIQEAMAGSGGHGMTNAGMGRPGMSNPGMTNNGMGYGTNASTGPGMQSTTGGMVGAGSSGMGMPNTGTPK
ncbi:MAG: hypothetical protein ACREF1_03470 [Acetobacteraceae bacterium]